MSRHPRSTEPFRIGSLTGSVYVPNLLFAIGQGAAIPVIALVALDLGASPAAAGFIVALRGIGTLVFDIPAGLMVARIGERWSMLLATATLGLVAVGIASQPSIAVYSALVFLLGGAWSVWALARLTYATEATPPRQRGRVMSIMGGTMRAGQFIGPLIGGLVIIPLGLAGPFFAQALFAVAAAVTLFFTVEPTVHHSRVETEPVPSLRTLLSDSGQVLRTAGFVAVAIQVLRTARQAIVPLWGDHLGLGASQISLIFGASAGIEMAIFYPIGMLMDRKGRKWAAVPCLISLSVGMALIPLTSTFAELAVVGLFLGLANGLGAGINMVLGSDFSPRLGRSQFFGIWRLISDLGTAGGPLLVAAVTSIASLGAAALAVAGFGLIGATVMWRAVPETLPADLE
ncbi:MAG TPA: MFS transporter [Acidimicrobiia bacterium]|nr:MFS transporter [Acidimicrobiia bacterium]